MQVERRDRDCDRQVGPWKSHVVDDGLLAFHSKSGTNVLCRNQSTIGLRRQAPRVLQVGLLTPCNLHCDFCYRDTTAQDRLDSDFLLELLTQASQWGVLEVAFGGGEPLLYPGLLDLLKELSRRTDMGLNITTNGTLLTPETAAELYEVTGEIRISALANNSYRRTLKMLSGSNVGVNWLVTPANVGLIEPYLRDFLSLGAKNVLLLGYKGGDASLHLQPDHLDILKRAVMRLQHLPLRLDVCWYPLLPELPHLFPRKDCDAGDELLVITPDRAVQPCSFHHKKIPFETFEDLRTIYHDLRNRRPAASICGCTRASFPQTLPEAVPPGGKLWVWQARASNNSGDWTIVGRFQTPEEASKAAESLRELARAHEAFLASPEGRNWLEENEYMGCIPTPPLRLFGEKHGFAWDGDDNGLWWEEDGCGAPVLTAGAVGDAVVVYHPYCMGLPEEQFKQFFAAAGATEFRFEQYDRPAVVATATGNNPAAIDALMEYLSLIDAAEYPSAVKSAPPWGSQCQDARLLDDEDRETRLATGRYGVRQDGDQLHLTLPFENTFAGTVALENWLAESGYRDIEIRVDNVLEKLPQGGVAKASPQTGLFGDVRPLAERLESASPEKVVELVFSYHSEMPDVLTKTLKEIPKQQRLDLCRAQWKQAREQGRDVTWQALLIIQDIGPLAADWMRTVWQQLPSDEWGFALKSLAASLPPGEAFDLAKAWTACEKDSTTGKTRLMAFGNLANSQTLGLIEQWWESADPGDPVTEDWGRLAAESRISWPEARAWLEQGRPLSLIALDALLYYIPRRGYPGIVVPPDFEPPQIDTFRAVLADCRDNDNAPRVDRVVGLLLKNATLLTE